MKYAYEGSNGGYPLGDDQFDRWYDEMIQHHECCICMENGHEETMCRTNWGWMHLDCYQYTLENAEPNEETPIKE